MSEPVVFYTGSTTWTVPQCDKLDAYLDRLIRQVERERMADDWRREQEAASREIIEKRFANIPPPNPETGMEPAEEPATPLDVSTLVTGGNCPKCKEPLYTGYGMAGGGLGIYEWCVFCGVISKVEDSGT